MGKPVVLHDAHLIRRNEMTKQEEIKQEVEYIITVNRPYVASQIADRVIEYLHDNDVVIKVDEIKEIATAASKTESFYAQGNGIALISTAKTSHIFKALKEAGCGFFEPLIKEAKDG